MFLSSSSSNNCSCNEKALGNQVELHCSNFVTALILKGSRLDKCPIENLMQLLFACGILKMSSPNSESLTKQRSQQMRRFIARGGGL